MRQTTLILKMLRDQMAMMLRLSPSVTEKIIGSLALYV